MLTYTFLNQFKGERKKEVKQKILTSIEKRKEQIKWFEKHFIEPQKKVLNIGMEVLKSQMPIEHYLKENKRLSEYITKLFRRVFDEL